MGVRLNIPPVGVCPRAKQRHHSRAMAEVEIDRLAMLGLDRPELGPLHHYWCRACGAWHVGHRKATGGGDSWGS